MIALLFAAVLAVGAQGPLRAPDREAHVVAMPAIDETGATLDDLPQSVRPLRVPKRDPVSSRLAAAMRGRLRTILCCAVLQVGAFAGVPMRPEQIRDVMRSLNQPKIAQTNPEEDPSAGRV